MSDKKIIEDHPYIRYSKPILSDKEMLARSPFLKQWTVDVRQESFQIDQFPEKFENLIKRIYSPFWCTQATMDFASLKIPKSKKTIAAEEEEMQSYESRMSSDWLDDLKPLGTDWRKPF
jgi:hypothetical protein